MSSGIRQRTVGFLNIYSTHWRKIMGEDIAVDVAPSLEPSKSLFVVRVPTPNPITQVGLAALLYFLRGGDQ